MNELEAKKKALVAESEVYRQTLKLEIQNLRLCAIRAQRKVSLFGVSSSFLMLAAPLAGSLFRSRRRHPLKRVLKAAFVGWRLYRKVGPLIGALFSTRNRRPKPRAEHGAPAADI